MADARRTNSTDDSDSCIVPRIGATGGKGTQLMNPIDVSTRLLMRIRRAVDQLAKPAHGATRPVLELRLWRLQQGRLCRQSLAMAYVRAGAYRHQRG
jgi:hypothetical protein